MRNLSKSQIIKFQRTISSYYYKFGRHDLPWRKTTDPYYILISEIMLQQTQVARVVSKYNTFIKQFPKIDNLANASLKSILRLWSGLGYNRRAIALKKTAEIIYKKYNGKIPNSYAKLITLPGIGPTTANEILAFAFNEPTVFIETNIRSVYIYSFFSNKEKVSDKDIIPLIEQTLDKSNPRTWYYRLMDYGAMLKSKNENPSKRSSQYTKQTRFEGSNRQARGIILKTLLKDSLTEEELCITTNLINSKIKHAFSQLHREGFIKKKKNKYMIA